MRDQKILVTGPTGQVAGPVATHLSRENEVWATARFSDESKKAALESEGITCVRSDFEAGDFSDLP
ncbi:MAG TPA: NAD(P)-dependent oxidoreductase, partial [Myxococcota bacterium]|nr:NAD(P)-dependent oxidoreductase [Myxococcota bacterium]